MFRNSMEVLVLVIDLFVELNGNGNTGETFIVSEAVLQIYHGIGSEVLKK